MCRRKPLENFLSFLVEKNERMTRFTSHEWNIQFKIKHQSNHRNGKIMTFSVLHSLATKQTHTERKRGMLLKQKCHRSKIIGYQLVNFFNYINKYIKVYMFEWRPLSWSCLVSSKWLGWKWYKFFEIVFTFHRASDLLIKYYP